jgi:hypothetical protein
MSDPIKHECGLAFIRLRKSFSYYQQQYGTMLWGLNKLYLLMEKQHNRGQDGAGIASVKLNVEPGYPFLNRIRSNAPQAICLCWCLTKIAQKPTHNKGRSKVLEVQQWQKMSPIALGCGYPKVSFIQPL